MAIRGAIAESLHRARKPFCVVVDDLQWADAGTLGVLELLADRPPATMLLVVTVRAGDLRPSALACVAELSRRAVRIDLGGLAVDDVEQWIAVGSDRAALARRVHDRTGGHPFFIREIVALIGAGDGGAAALAGVPAAVHDVVRRRVAQLRPEAQQLLATAAVLGRRVDLGVLAGVVDEPIDAVLDAARPGPGSRVAGGRSRAHRAGAVRPRHRRRGPARRAEPCPPGPWPRRRHQGHGATLGR